MEDIQDWLPYVLSIMLIVVLTCSLMLRLYCDVARFWLIGNRIQAHIVFPLIVSITSHPAPLRLSRMIRRKEAPDDDGSDCCSPLMATSSIHQRGGTIWTYLRDSLQLQQKEVAFTG
ncbi:hypothetical protein [Paenibacillus campi]|uniref:hypothetical protein n=1 Tax=Paenibacillus campi TaxID=3106031 RepID=UPI002AFF561A|nr:MULTISPECIES: hypothetical protein [unclassified Paenibacillus]